MKKIAGMHRKNLSDIHIGQIIKEKISEKGISYSAFASLISVSRSSLYLLFESKSIDVDRLMIISDVLEYDFIHEVYYEDVTSEDVISVPVSHSKLQEGKITIELKISK